MHFPHIARFITGVAAIIIYMAGSSAIAGDRVALNDANVMLLQGHWEGDYVSKDTQGEIRWQSTVTLVVPEQTPPVQEGQFSLKKNGKSWSTKIKIQNGNAIMGIGFKERTFILEQDGDQYTLHTTYRDKFEGYPRNITVDMKRE